MPDAKITIRRNSGVLDGCRMSAFRRVVVVITIVASLTRDSSSCGYVQLWTDFLCGVCRVKSGIGQWIASIATMWWFVVESIFVVGQWNWGLKGEFERASELNRLNEFSAR